MRLGFLGSHFTVEKNGARDALSLSFTCSVHGSQCYRVKTP
jgi:hypothetical protein